MNRAIAISGKLNAYIAKLALAPYDLSTPVLSPATPRTSPSFGWINLLLYVVRGKQYVDKS
jgi:hypothetical protein